MSFAHSLIKIENNIILYYIIILLLMSIETFINIIPFSEKYKDIVIEKCLDNSHTYLLLSGLKQNWSWEGGFELELTDEWKELLKNKNVDLSILNYHNMRQLRFIHDNKSMITGLRCKDMLPYWNQLELEAIRDLVNSVTRELYML